MKQLLDNGALVTLGLVGVVAAVGAANKAGLYGSTGSAARGKVTMRPLADYIPGKYRGRVIGDASYVESHNLDRREIEEIKLYLEENGFTVSVETSDADLHGKMREGVRDTFGHRTVIRAMPVRPSDSGTAGSAARGVTEGYVESYLDGDNIAISTFLNRHLRGKAKQFAGQYARRLKAALDAMVVSGEVYRDTTPNRAPSYRRTSSDSGTAGSAARAMTRDEAYSQLRRTGEISTGMLAHLGMSMDQFLRYAQLPTHRQKALVNVLLQRAATGSAARALRGPPHVGPSVKRMVDFLKIPKVHAAAVKARMDDGVPYKAILEVVDGLMDGNGVEYIDSHADTMRSQDGLSYVNMGDTYDSTLLYDHKTGRFSVGSWGDIVEKQPARFR